jgi:cephalosporin hydroxylase
MSQVSRSSVGEVIAIDMEAGTVTVTRQGADRVMSLGDADGFAAVSRAWLRAGWDAKYVYSFAWMGRPIIQLPEDLIRLQEVIVAVQPDVIVETGVAHGGSLMFSASLLKAMGGGRVIGVDVEIRPHNREAIETHFLGPLVSLIEGNSTDASVVGAVRGDLRESDKVMVLLDSDHTKAHVAAELDEYAPLVSPGSYIVVMDGIMGDLVGAPRAGDDWAENNPRAAALEFVAGHPEFVIEEPTFPFNEGMVTERVTYWPSGFLKRIN